MTIINLPNDLNDDFGKSIYELFEVQKQLESSDYEVEVNYANAKFTMPFFTLGLLLLLKQYKTKRKIKCNFNFTKPNVSSYMDNIFFPNFLHCDNTSFENVSNILEGYRSKKYLPLLSFPIVTDFETSKIRDAFLNHFNQLIYAIIQAEPRLRSAISYLITETFENIVHHAKFDNGYVLVQTFPNKGYIDFAIGDLGRTLLDTYKEFKDNVYDVNDDLSAMKSALSGKSTKRQDISRGFGISTSIKVISEGLGGKYFLYSGNTFTVKTDQADEIFVHSGDVPIYWQGALVFIRLPLIAPADFKLEDYYE